MEDDEEALLERLRADPSNVEAEIDLGYLLLKGGRIEEGIAALRRGVGIQPDHIDARRNLAFTLYDHGMTEEAVASLREWQDWDPNNPVARHLLAAFTGTAIPSRAADDYISFMFDRVAGEFDEHIAGLGYRAPRLVSDSLGAVVGGPLGNLDILDAGCGTGLCGPGLRPYARRLVGVDLSGGMLAEAERRACYDRVERSEMTAYMTAHAGNFDVVAAADALIYFGDLGPPLSAAAEALRFEGYLVFTVEASQAGMPGAQLNPHGRYSHTEAYVRGAVAEAGLRLCSVKADALRHETGLPVPGFIVAAQRRR